MSPEQSLRSATIDGARLVGLSDRLGSLEPGKQADVILMSGDPLADAEVLSTVDRVYLRGTRYSRDELNRFIPNCDDWSEGW